MRGADDRGSDRRWDDPGSAGTGGAPSVFILVFGVFVVTTAVKIVRSILRSLRR